MTILASHTKISTSVMVVAAARICIGVPTSYTGIRKGKHISVNNTLFMCLQPLRLPELERYIQRAISIICLARLPELSCIFRT